MDIFYAILLGTAFGFVLQRIGAADPDEIVGMLRLSNLRLAKAILLAIGLSSLVLFGGMTIGVIDAGHLSVKTSYVGVGVGGLLLGAGWALSGFCPGTGVVAAGTGRRDALAFLVGGLAGAALFMGSYAPLAETLLFDEVLGGKATLANTESYDALLTLPALVVAAALAALFMGAAFLLPNALGAPRAERA